jgi:hypothetical protein
MNHETVWSFETARFVVALEIEPEDMDPADSFEFDEEVSICHYFPDMVSGAISEARKNMDKLCK